MHAAFFETFCLRLAAGLALALLVVPSNAVNPRFHRIQLVIVLGLTAAATTLAWQNANDLFFLGVGAAAGAAVFGSLLWTVRLNPGAVGTLVAVVVGLLLALATLHARTTDGAPLLVVLDDLTAAAVLGIATTAMLMGHWYLIAPTMSLLPLLRLVQALFLALGIRILMAGGELIAGWSDGGLLDELAWVWLLVRWGVGFVGAGVLNWMAWQTARIRSTQSATGILYVVTIFCFFGELTSQLLQEHLAELG
jgi:hypothetical protein